MRKRLPAIILMLSLFTTVSLAATTYKKQIEVEYGITISINEQVPTLTDVNGKTVQPFVYNGTTYVPIRAVANAFGADINYNESNNTAYVYDDYTELLVASYKLQRCAQFFINGLDNYYREVKGEYAWKDWSDTQKINEQRISNNQEMIQLLLDENVHESYFDDIVSEYQKVVAAYLSAEQLYLSLKKSNDTGENSTFGKWNSDALWGFVYLNEKVDLLYNTSNWRNIGADLSV